MIQLKGSSTTSVPVIHLTEHLVIRCSINTLFKRTRRVVICRPPPNLSHLLNGVASGSLTPDKEHYVGLYASCMDEMVPKSNWHSSSRSILWNAPMALSSSRSLSLTQDDSVGLFNLHYN
ncbi:Protein of unknown function [Gryllus bimaculatus]|nr:Protein of unknown function [Gryllus bimaculatus]